MGWLGFWIRFSCECINIVSCLQKLHFNTHPDVVTATYHRCAQCLIAASLGAAIQSYHASDPRFMLCLGTGPAQCLLLHPQAPSALVSWHPHILPGWDLCSVGVCSSLWQHRAVKMFCSVVLLCDVLGTCQEAPTKN